MPKGEGNNFKPPIKVLGFECIDKPNCQLLAVCFQDRDGREFRWYPRWAEVRDLLAASLSTECDNTAFKSKELAKFTDFIINLTPYIGFIKTTWPPRKIKQTVKWLQERNYARKKH